jgi:lysophospholipase L1-like esterase
LQGAIDFYARENQKPLRLEDIRANRLAQNALLRDFCAQEHIPMLDLTAPLQHAIESGRGMYFPDDTHWNAAGHDLAARELTEFMTGQP